ncbi:tyrosine-type recombinase/integrase [Thalassomonas sp. M1454]|uniref:tyrosine-type recombinase/integrase n=1 Tax=Thalassomonas sp. M1454 TaxID=2594477 RepID=UPI00117C9DBC|nr:site-specific integrase [Thalassomonas sp. M1454]TRX53475.1 site-specific integrase [Thalassomonas sp. M1454]
MAYFTIKKVVKNTKDRKTTTRYQVTVRDKQNGKVLFNKTKTFNVKSAATKWAKDLIHDIEHGVAQSENPLNQLTFGDLIRKYIDKVNQSNKPLGRTAEYSLLQVSKYRLSQTKLCELSSSHIIDFCYDRLSSSNRPQPQTVAMDISFIRTVLFHTKSMFAINIDDTPIIESYPTMKRLQLIARSNQRQRRLKENEYEFILEALIKYQSKSRTKIPYADLYEMSILTCLRVSELCQLEWKNLIPERSVIQVIDRKHPTQKQGNNMLLPLLGNGRALQIIEKQPKSGKYIFPYNPKSVATGFRRVVRNIGIEELRYHDLRREGCSRLIEKGFPLPHVAAVSGHKDLKVLHNIYVSIKPESLVALELTKNDQK